jgi:hypothetical protein
MIGDNNLMGTVKVITIARENGYAIRVAFIR